MDEYEATHWLAFIERQHRMLGGAETALPPLRSACAQLWQASRRGDICIPLDEESGLSNSPLVAVARDGRLPPGDVRPLVIDDGQLYLHRWWHAEVSVASRLMSLDAAAALPRGADPQRLLAGSVSMHADQLAALGCALSRRLAVISGGPGTGKTFVLAQLLILSRQLDADLRIAVAAPTGKAAARLSEALNAALADAPVAERFGSIEIVTLHRLLGARGDGRYGFGRQRQLPYDLLIVDEASMIDLELARHLLEAVGDHARLVLAGDRDQLSSVAPGSVFGDIIEAGQDRLRDAVVLLSHNYRQSGSPGLSALSSQIRGGRIEGSDFEGVEFRAAGQAREIVAHAADRYRSLLEPLQAAGGSTGSNGSAWPDEDEAAAVALLSGLARFRLLAALQEGPMGVRQLNRQIDALIRRGLNASPQAPWYPGRLVIVTRNARGLRLANGDVGLCLPWRGRLMVAFPGLDGLQRIAPAQMPACDDAWALTIHKSQGSEFDEVSLVLAPAEHPLSTRELAYTGVTRARRGLVLWGDPESLNRAVARREQRHGRLVRRLDQRVSGASAAGTSHCG